MVGEMALFSAARRRTQTARCAEATEIGWIERAALERLCYQNPAIAFHLLGLVTNRLIDNVARVEAGRDAARALD
jgi:CRP-like cAMP-binding protein